MRKVKEVAVTAIFPLILPTMAYAFPANTSDEHIIDSVESVQLVPNTPTYAMWANWIREEIARDTANYHDFKNGQFVATVINTDVDLITIRTAMYAPDALVASALLSPATPDEKPATLPVSGEPGEYMMIVSQTTNTYLSWTYSWKASADGGRGGWQLTSSAFHDCQYVANRMPGTRCEKS